MIEYKGYIGAVDFDPEINLFHGTVINTNDVITFYGASVTELREEMQRSIEGYIEFCKEQGKVPEKPFSGEFSLQMSPETPDLKNTIAHILEHKQHLSSANEAATQQYVILPILRVLGWDDANLASMEILPEHAVKDGNVDYALKVGKKLALFIECKRWNEPLERHEDQIVNYAFKAGVPIVGLTNGKIWRFYFSWIEGSSVSERIFCEIDVEDRGNAVSNLEKYLLKSNVVSGESELNAEIALEEKEKTDSFKPVPIHPKPGPANGIIDPKPIEPEATFSGEWTIERIKNSLPEEVKRYYEANYSEDRRNIFYGRVAETQNLIQAKGWSIGCKLHDKILWF